MGAKSHIRNNSLSRLAVVKVDSVSRSAALTRVNKYAPTLFRCPRQQFLHDGEPHRVQLATLAHDRGVHETGVQIRDDDVASLGRGRDLLGELKVEEELDEFRDRVSVAADVSSSKVPRRFENLGSPFVHIGLLLDRQRVEGVGCLAFGELGEVVREGSDEGQDSFLSMTDTRLAQLREQ